MPILPPLIIGLIMAAYWARVLRLAIKARRKTGNLGNLFPPETLGRLLRIIWFPAIFLWIGLPLIFAFAAQLPAVPQPMLPLVWSDLLAWAAVAIAVAAFIATLICWKKMGSSWRMGIDPTDKTQLIVTGPYARLRHPIYALSQLLMLCTMAIYPSPAMLAVGAIHIGLLQWEARREEQYLLTVHGQAYADYAKQTGRFLPKW